MTAVYSEDTLVQRTTADYLQSLGWRSVYAYEREDLGPEGLLGRRTQREVVLVRILRERLVALNPGLPAAAYDDAVRQLTASDASQTLVAANRAQYALIRNGVQVAYRDGQGRQRQRRLRVIAFDDPAANDFLCVRELWVRGDLYRRRPDIIGFVNGLPLLFVECKNIHTNLRAAFEKNYADYRDTIPHLLHHNAIVLFGNGDQARIGSITSQWGHFFQWKRLAEADPGVVDMETLLKGVCSKAQFLDIVENFIVFDDSMGATRKILARNHQYLGVNRAFRAVETRGERDGRLGTFWHTQGAGKSYSMVFLARKVHRKLGANFTFLVLTDRADLDTQIFKTFAGCGVVDNDSDPCRARSGRHLRRLLTEQKAYVFSLIQKFNREVSPKHPYSARDDIIVMSDEAHRTQYGTLALNMRNALPNAGYIGFTGTPLFKEDEITRQVFGPYVSTYDFKRAVDDHATVPLYYDARGDKLNLALDDLNERVAQVIDDIENAGEDIDLQLRLERELLRDYHVITADKRLDQIAQDLVQHYSTAWESGKAMLVCIDKLTCVRMHQRITVRWQERIGELERALLRTRSEQDAAQLERQIAWMRETRVAVVVSEEQGEVAKFRRWGIDIKPHRQLIKQGMDLPESLRDKPRFRNLQRMPLDEAFKEEEHPFRIAIVCAMWLTGFDVPSLGTLYLDKPLKAHTLMQAIARANRVNEGKTNGLVVDYCGILKQLRRALATFAGTQPEGETVETDPTQPQEKLLEKLEEALGLARQPLREAGASLEAIIRSQGFARNAAIRDCKEAANQNDQTRRRFEIICRQVFRAFRACLNIPEVNAYRGERDALDIVYKSLQRDREEVDLSEIIKRLHGLIDEAIETVPQVALIAEENAVYDMSRIDFERLKEEFRRSETPNSTVQDLRQVVEKRLQRMMERNPLRTDYYRRYQGIVEAYNAEKERENIERTFEALLRFMGDLDEEDSRAVREGLDEESLAVYDLLKQPELTPSEIKRVKAVAVELLATLKAEKLRVDHWRDKQATRDAVRAAIGDFLYSDATGLPLSYPEGEIPLLADEVYQHVYRAYPRVPSPVYETVAA